MDKHAIISALISKKYKIFNLRVKVGNRKFKLNGVGSENLKVKPTRLPDYPHMDLVGFLPWNEWDNFTEKERKLVEAFYGSLPK